MSTAIYTAVIGCGDKLKEPSSVTKDWDSFLFTDQRVGGSIWDVKKLPVCDRVGPAKTSRRPKILCCDYLPEYDVSIWVDSKFFMTVPLNAVIDKFLCGFDMAMMRHNKRQCVYDEARFCQRIKKGSWEEIESQVNRYRKDGYPENNGLAAGGILIRRHNDVVRELTQTWWEELEGGSGRDQLSFNYAYWKTGNKAKINFVPFYELYDLFFGRSLIKM